MSDTTQQPGEADETYDLDQVFGDDEVDSSVYGTSYSPPEKPRGMTRFGTTAAEEAEGEHLDQRFSQEEPDPNLATELGAAPDDENVDAVDDSRVEDEDLSWSEVGRTRAGRLVDPDQGLGADEEKDLIGSDVGMDEGAASAEEAAVHVID